MSTIEQTLESLSQADTVSLRGLGIQAQAISMESVDKSFVDASKGYLGDFLRNVAGTLEKVTLRFTDPGAFSKWPKVQAIKDKYTYKELRNTVVKVPAGLGVSYSDFLHQAAMDLSHIEMLDRDLTTVVSELAQYNSNPEKLLAQSAGQPLRKLDTAQYATLTKFQSMFTKGGKTDALFGHAFQSVNELELIIKQSEELRKRVSRIDFAAIDKKVTRVAELVGKLRKQTQDKPELSGAAASALSASLEGLAVTVTLGAVMVEAIAGTSNALSHTVDIL